MPTLTWTGSGHEAATHAGDLVLPPLLPPRGDGPVPVVVLVHGGFWHAPYDRSLMAPLAADCAARGWAAWNVDYCRIEDREGGWPGTLLDVAAAFDHLRQVATEHPLDLSRVAVVGHSAGGHLALWLASRHRLDGAAPHAAPFVEGRASRTTPLQPLAVVSLAGVADLVGGADLGDGSAAELLGGSPSDVPDRYAVASPLGLVPSGVPTMLVHGDADDRVPVEQSLRYAAAAGAGEEPPLVELWRDETMGHFEVIDPEHASWQAVASWLASQFAAPADMGAGADGAHPAG